MSYVLPSPLWSIEIKDGKIVYCETTEIGTVETGKWQTVTFSRTGKDTRMTEKEFLAQVLEPKYTPNFILCNAAEKALILAKQHGAKFDPEPVVLPSLIGWSPISCLQSKQTKLYDAVS